MNPLVEDEDFFIEDSGPVSYQVDPKQERENAEYCQQKFANALKIPKEYLGYEKPKQ